MRMQADDPVRLLGPAVACYLDAISFAAEHHVSQETKDNIDTAAQRLGLTQADAWPTLRSHLLLIAANGHNPTTILDMAHKLGSLDTARDPAAVIDYRLDLTKANIHHTGPLPWLPGIPSQLLTDHDWGPYLHARYTLTEELESQTLDAATDQTPRWAHHLPDLDPTLVDDIRLWRAAHNTPDTDLRPTGPIRWTPAERKTNATSTPSSSSPKPTSGNGARASSRPHPHSPETPAYRSSPPNSPPSTTPATLPTASSTRPPASARYPTTTPPTPSATASPTSPNSQHHPSPGKTTTHPRRRRVPNSTNPHHP
jgi:hypothetical protein